MKFLKAVGFWFLATWVPITYILIGSFSTVLGIPMYLFRLFKFKKIRNKLAHWKVNLGRLGGKYWFWMLQLKYGIDFAKDTTQSLTWAFEYMDTMIEKDSEA